MQFVLLIYQGTTPLPNTPEWESLSQEEQRAIYADYAALGKVEGITPGLPLGLPEQATTVRVDSGQALASEGPYVDGKGAVGGYFVLEADDLDAAIAIAASIPAARHGGAIEVRPVATYW
ncbi:MAG: YciI family protein [Acidimicrobiia bacterium]